MPEESTGPTLTQVAYIARQSIKFGGILLVVFIVGRTFLSAFSAYWTATHPPAPPPPTVGFGVLPALRFPVSATSERPTSYTLETATGTLPSFSDRAKVYLMLKSTPSLLDDEHAKQVAAAFDFVFAPEILSATQYRFLKTSPLEATLTINIVNNRFSLTTDYLSRPELLANSEVPDKIKAVSAVKSALSSANLLESDVATASGETIFMKAIGNDLTPALSFSDADYIQVDLKRDPIDGQYEGFTSNGEDGVIHAVVSGAFSGKNSIVELMNQYQAIDYTQVQTYPLRTTQQAWQILQSGEGYIAQKGENDTAVIRSVQLGYYESDEEQDYYQPIYVFEGDGGFIGFVSAIDPKYLQPVVSN